MPVDLHETASICPKCKRKVQALLVEIDESVQIVRNCPEHGQFRDRYWESAEHYRWLMQYQTGVSRSFELDPTHDCTTHCGLCEMHNVETVIALIDVTNDCDLNCPVCLTNSGDNDYHYRPDLEQIRHMLQALRSTTQSTVGPTVAFTGGEPTLRDDLPELVKLAHEEGFSRTEVITNGIRIAQDLDYVMALRQAGLSQLGLQFDGMNDQVYQKLRGIPLLSVKLRAVENLRIAGQPTILAVCLARGVNDHQLGNIIEFAAQNRDIVEHVNVQTMAFTGRASELDVEEGRITPSEFAKLVEEQTKGIIKTVDFYPPSFVAPLPEFIEAYSGKPQIKFFVHPCCDLATYVLVNEDGSLTPVNDLLNVTGLLDTLKKGRQEILTRKGFSKRAYKILAPFTILKAIAGEIHSPVFRRMLFAGLGRKGYDPLSGLDDVLMITCANYMDVWNFDIEKAQSCGMHYLLPDGRRIPFCCYNVLHRGIMERQFATSAQM